MKRVVQVVCSPAFAGVERQVADVSSGLAERGVNVSVVGGNHAVMRATLPADVGWQPGNDLRQTMKSLRAVCGADRPIVHAHMTAAELAAVVLPRRARGPVVVTRHFAEGRGRSPAGRLARPLIERRIDAQLAVSEFVAAAIGPPCRVLANGVPPTPVGPEPGRGRTVLVLQRLEAEKDTATALRGWRMSELAAANWRLVIHGRGSEEADLRSLAAELGVADSTEFAGFTAAPRMALAHCGMLLAPALAEPFGLSVVEAMAEATPVVATDAGAHRETLGEHGRFFAARDVAGCAAALRELAGDESGRRQRGARLQSRFSARFTLAQQVDALLALYAELEQNTRARG